MISNTPPNTAATVSGYYIGLMTGTSADGVDAALVNVTGGSPSRETTVQATCQGRFSAPFSASLSRSIHAIRTGDAVSLARAGAITRAVSLACARAARRLLAVTGVDASNIVALGVHGQTVYHAPPVSTQWLDPALVAAKTGIGVVSGFRQADLAAGGQGAPLVPRADELLFADPGQTRLVLNLGGIANLTLLPATSTGQPILGFDTGPANCISDWLVRSRSDANGTAVRKNLRHIGEFQPSRGQSGVGRCDLGGKLASQGKAIERLVGQTLADMYFEKAAPKSTDGPAMIDAFTRAAHHVGVDLATTPLPDLLASAARVCADAILRAVDALPATPSQLIAAGGGTRNAAMVGLLREGCTARGIDWQLSDELGIPTDAREAVCFALLAALYVMGLPGNVPSVTGARRAVVLGSYTPPPATRADVRLS
ncbi:MAG: anhydro-N-acetylmuramic acid kinase [Planctomycetota bacterium]